MSYGHSAHVGAGPSYTLLPMIVSKPRPARALRATLLAVGAMLVAAPLASAATVTSDYAPDAVSRNFSAGEGGWTSSVFYAGGCQPGVTCPRVTNSFIPGGGTGGASDGHIRTALSSPLGIPAQSNGVWLSPAFVYQGAGGQRPDAVAFALSFRGAVAALLGNGDSASFFVDIVQQGGPGALQVIGGQSLADSEDWRAQGPIGINPASLEIGAAYQIRITTSYQTGVSATPSASADYDDVLLRAVREVSDGDGDGGGDGDGDGGGGGGGDDKPTRECLPGVGRIAKDSVGRLRLDDSRNRLISRSRTNPRISGNSVRFCVEGGGIVGVAFRKGRAIAIVTKAQGYRLNGIDIGDSRSSFSNGKTAKKLSRDLYRVGDGFVGLRRGFVSQLGLAQKKLLKKRAKLAAAIELAVE